MPNHVLSVGQCGPDDARLSRFVRDACEAALDRAAAADAAMQKLSSGDYALVLVNRVFDYGGESGIDFIADLRTAGILTPVMLVSDYPEAQAAAIAQGALRGFGKSQLSLASTAEMVRLVVRGSAS